MDEVQLGSIFNARTPGFKIVDYGMCNDEGFRWDTRFFFIVGGFYEGLR
jgi:hypothetical protein